MDGLNELGCIGKLDGLDSGLDGLYGQTDELDESVFEGLNELDELDKAGKLDGSLDGLDGKLDRLDKLDNR